MSGATTSNYQSTDDINAIIAGMGNAPQADRARAPLPTQLQPGYRPTMPPQIGGQPNGTTVPPGTYPDAYPPQQSRAPWAQPAPQPAPGQPAPASSWVPPVTQPLATQQAAVVPLHPQVQPQQQPQPQPQPQQPAPVSPQQAQQSFIQTYGPLAQQVGQQLGVDPRLILGQWAMESGWGVGGGAAAGGNMAGIKGPNGQYEVYRTPQEFADAYLQRLRNPRYQGAIGAGSNAQQFFGALKRGGYFEADLGQYQNAVFQRISAFGNQVQPQQQLMPATPRAYNEWGKPPPGMGMNVPGAMPQPNQFGQIMTGIAPLLLAIGSLALRLPLSSAITAYGAMARAQQNGQNLEYQRNRTLWRDKLAESTAQQTLESQAASDAFSEYGNNNPQGLQQRLAQIALQYNDPTMYRMAEQGDLNGIHELQKQRDQRNQYLVKLNRGAQEQEGEVHNVVDADGKPTGQQVREGRTGGLFDLNGQPVQLQPGERLETKGAEKPEQESEARNVLGADGKPTGQQVREGKTGGLFDLDGNRVHLKQGETLAPARGTAEKPEQEGEVKNVLGADGKPTGQQVREGKTGGLFDLNGQPVQLKPGERLETKGAAEPGAGEMEGPVYNVIGADQKPTGRQVRAGKRGGLYDVSTNQPATLGPGETVQEAGRPSAAGSGMEAPLYNVLDKDGNPTGQQVRLGRAGGIFDAGSSQPTTLKPGEHLQPVRSGTGSDVAPTFKYPDNWDGMPNKPPPGADETAWALAVQWAQTGKTPTGLGKQTAMLAQVERLLPAAQHALGMNPTTAYQQQLKIAGELAAEKYWTAGMGQRQLQYLNTTASHLNLFRQYAEALHNGEVQRANGILQTFAAETGHPEITDYNTAKVLMADEVVRLLTQTGGSRGDRDDAQHLAASNFSEEQLEGVADTLENFVRGRFEAMQTSFVHIPGVNDADVKERTQQFQQMMTPEARQMFGAPARPIPGADQPAQPGQLVQPGQSQPATVPPGWTIQEH